MARLSGEGFEADEERRDGGGTMTEDRRGAAIVVFMALDVLASSGGGGIGALPGGGDPKSEAAFHRGFSSDMGSTVPSAADFVSTCGVVAAASDCMAVGRRVAHRGSSDPRMLTTRRVGQCRAVCPGGSCNDK